MRVIRRPYFIRPLGASSSIVSTPTSNFGFLQAHDPLLVRLAGFAELYATSDPNAAILRLRQFARSFCGARPPA
jgi:hypothetical protein